VRTAPSQVSTRETLIDYPTRIQLNDLPVNIESINALEKRLRRKEKERSLLCLDKLWTTPRYHTGSAMNGTGWLGLAWLGLAWLGFTAGMEVHAMYPWLNPTCQDIGVSAELTIYGSHLGAT
jgi:hypothetical protein